MQRVAYQRLVNKVLEDQIGKNMEVYVGDVLTKSKIAVNHIKDPGQTLDDIKRHQMKLNPTKCVFRVK